MTGQRGVLEISELSERHADGATIDPSADRPTRLSPGPP